MNAYEAITAMSASMIVCRTPLISKNNIPSAEPATAARPNKMAPPELTPIHGTQGAET